MDDKQPKNLSMVNDDRISCPWSRGQRAEIDRVFKTPPTGFAGQLMNADHI